VRTIEESKKQIKQQFQNEELTSAKAPCSNDGSKIQAVFAQENLQGIELITPEQEKFYSNS
jgi:hypothetical protein